MRIRALDLTHSIFQLRMLQKRPTCDFYAIMKLIFLTSAFLLFLPASGKLLHGENGLSPPNAGVLMSAFPQAAFAINNRLLLTRDLIQPKSTRDFYAAIPFVIQAFLNWFEDHTEKTQCSRDLYDFVVALRESKLWALQIVDAWGKIGSGIIKGNVVWDGNYNQCLKIKATPYVNDTYERTYETQYCWAIFSIKAIPTKLPSTLDSQLATVINVSTFYPLRSAVCIPDSCTEDEINDMMDRFMPMLPVGKYLTYRGIACIQKDPSLWDDTGAVIAFAICCIIGACLLLGTLYDVFQRHSKTSEFAYSKLPNSEPSVNSAHQKQPLAQHDAKLDETDITSLLTMPQGVRDLAVVKNKKRKIGDLFLAFSVYTNASKILSLKTAPDAIPVINGIRFLSMACVIFGHTFTNTAIDFNDPVELLDVTRSIYYHLVSSTLFAPDTFFILSGLLTAYICLAGYEKTDGKFSWVQYYVHRFWRLTPPYVLFMYIVHMKLSKYFSNGPYWDPYGFAGGCDEYWWQNILYINNFNSITNMCMSWTWFIASDMQFFVFSPIVLIPMANRWIKTTFLIAGSLILTSITLFGALFTHYGAQAYVYPHEFDHDITKYTNAFDKIYTRPYTRMAPYVIGMMTGWLVYEHRTAKLKRGCVILGWVVSIIAGTSIVLCTYHAHMTLRVEAFYHSINKVVWPLCMTWLIFACATGNGGIIHTILSYPVWNPFSRLTYMAYLWHFLIIIIACTSINAMIQFSYTYVFFYFLAMTFMSYLGAFVLTLAFESPFMALEKFIFGR